MHHVYLQVDVFVLCFCCLSRYYGIRMRTQSLDRMCGETGQRKCGGWTACSYRLMKLWDREAKVNPKRGTCGCTGRDM